MFFFLLFVQCSLKLCKWDFVSTSKNNCNYGIVYFKSTGKTLSAACRKTSGTKFSCHRRFFSLSQNWVTIAPKLIALDIKSPIGTSSKAEQINWLIKNRCIVYGLRINVEKLVAKNCTKYFACETCNDYIKKKMWCRKKIIVNLLLALVYFQFSFSTKLIFIAFEKAAKSCNEKK